MQVTIIMAIYVDTCNVTFYFCQSYTVKTNSVTIKSSGLRSINIFEFEIKSNQKFPINNIPSL